MRAAKLFAVTLLVFASTHASKAAAEPPRFGEIPIGHVTTPPQQGHVPGAIGAGETVKGFFVASPRFSGAMEGLPLTVVGSSKLAARVREGQQPSEDDAGAGCLSEMQNFGLGLGAERDAEWNPTASVVVSVFQRTAQNPSGGVAALHLERVVTDGAAVSLESTDAWVDPRTRGVRAIDKAVLPLKLVDTSMGSVRVYVGRDDKPGTDKLLQFVVVSSIATKLRAPMTAITDGVRFVHSSCGHLRVSLPIEASGRTMAVNVPVELPTLGAPEPVASAGFMGTGQKLAERELRVREVKVQLAVSQTSRDREPVVSVSFGWAGRERLERTLVPVAPDAK